ncbi:hypothetical protein [Nesterenkonia sp. HG001]|uniref:hypothetical protein n=1 Tax=Nesterenkonia sp. HG001 TaxID=2983207 RepID=UPI002AC6EDD8|nr:hypothetical protein [Nesterenkonia sp. HG001]MDZ5077482.1 hypothetical protein [Nesterenkonia sp. HG001]
MIKKPTRLAVVLWTCILAGFALMEFPGVLFFHDMVEPRIFGMPFIYGFNVVIWAFMCVVLFIGYRTHWGRRAASEDDESDAPDPAAEPTGGAR